MLLSERSTDKDGKTWSYTLQIWTALTYTVEEEAVDGFNTSISGSMADGFTITNSKKLAAAVAAAVTTSRTRNRLPIPIPIRSLRLIFRISLHRLIR
ncbi:MAG: Cna B-type domain-containing protein [Butyricicoccus sp.]